MTQRRSRLQSPRSALRTAQQLDLLLEEYRAMYSLALFRVGSLERRVPVGGAALAGFLAASLSLPSAGQLILLVAIPVSLLWLLRTTINHARSFEDAIRRIEEIERSANALAGAELLVFQSSHPSRGARVGGRTGSETVHAVLIACGLALLACLHLFLKSPLASSQAAVVFPVMVALIAGALICETLRFPAYRYTRQA